MKLRYLESCFFYHHSGNYIPVRCRKTVRHSFGPGAGVSRASSQGWSFLHYLHLLVFLWTLAAFTLVVGTSTGAAGPPPPGITGEVKGVSGIDLRGASVTLNSSNITAFSNDAGLFVIPGPDSPGPAGEHLDDYLTVSLEGYITKEIPLSSYEWGLTIMLEAEPPYSLAQVDSLLASDPWFSVQERISSILQENGHDPGLAVEIIYETITTLHQLFLDLDHSGSTLRWSQAKYALDAVGKKYFSIDNSLDTYGTTLRYDREMLYRVANMVDMELGEAFPWKISGLNEGQVELIYELKAGPDPFYGIPGSSPYYRVTHNNFVFPYKAPYAGGFDRITPGAQYLLRPLAARITAGAQTSYAATALLVDWVQKNLFHTYRDTEAGEVWSYDLYLNPPWGNGTQFYPVDTLWYGGFLDFAAPLSERAMGCDTASEILAALSNSIGIPAYPSLYESYYEHKGGAEHYVTMFPSISEEIIVVHGDFPLDHWAMPPSDLMLPIQDFVSIMTEYDDNYTLYSHHLKEKNRREMILTRRGRNFHLKGYIEVSPDEKDAMVAEFLSRGVPLECHPIQGDSCYRCRPEEDNEIPIAYFIELLQGVTFPGDDPSHNLLINGGFQGTLDGWIVNPALLTGESPWTPLLSINRESFLGGPGVSLQPGIHGFRGTILYQNLNLTGVGGKDFTLGARLTNVGPGAGENTAAAWLTYVDDQGTLQRVKAFNPPDDSLAACTLARIPGGLVLPAEAQRVVKLELAGEGEGIIHASEVILWAEGVTALPVPQVNSLSARQEGDRRHLEIKGTHFGETQGSISLGENPTEILSWSGDTIEVAIPLGLRSGRVIVTTAEQVESNPSAPLSEVLPPGETYTITFDSTGGSEVPAQTLDYNSLVTEPEAPTKADHDFAGWYREAELTTPWDFAADRVPAGDITLYARWTFTDDCFIATAAFGSRLDPAVALLRHFRDEKLLTNKPGQAFVSCYYKFSPAIARVINGNNVLKGMTRVILLPLVVLVFILIHPPTLYIIIVCISITLIMLCVSMAKNRQVGDGS